jgi:transcriptional regulator with PAS, ATPase and Fis domain
MTSPFDKTPMKTAPGMASGAKPRALCVVVLASPDKAIEGRSFPLVENLCVGRGDADDVNLRIDDARMSRRHFSIARSGSSIFIEDCGSTNGTYVEGQKVDRCALDEHTLVRAANTLLFLTLREGGAQRRTETVVGDSMATRSLLEAVDRVAATALPVLVLGETGTGKDVVARELHARSRRSGAFVAVNCAAIPASLAESFFFGAVKGAFSGSDKQITGHFQAAHRGTLFLDEVGDMPLELQTKLLRAVDGQPVTPLGSTVAEAWDVRIVAATNVALEARCSEGRFRLDFFARLAAQTLRTTPLRERRDDVLALFRHFAGGISSSGAPWPVEVLERLLLHDWPMNVRELKNVAARVLTASHDQQVVWDQLDVLLALDADSPRRAAPEKSARGKPDAAPSAEELETLLARHHGNVSDVAAALGRRRMQVYRWIDKNRIDVSRFR